MNSSIQNTQVTGTALKTISMRLRNTAGELEELEIDAEGAVDSITKLQTQLLNLTNNTVNIMEADGETFRSTYDIMVDLSKVWDSLSDKQRADITRLVAGVRQGNAFNSMMSNMADGISATEVALNSQGSAARENAKYLDSIDGKLKQLSATFEQFSVQTLNSGLVKFFIDLANGLLQLLNSVGGLLPILVAFAGILLALKFDAIALSLAKMLGTVTRIGRAFIQAATGTISFSAALSGLRVGMSATQAVILAVTIALTALIVIISAVTAYHEEMVRKTYEAADAAKEETNSLNQLIASYKKLKEQETQDDSTREQIKSLQSQIVDLVGDQAEGLDLVNGRLDEQLGKLKEITTEQAKQNKTAFISAYNTAKQEAEGSGTYKSGIISDEEKQALSGVVPIFAQSAGSFISITGTVEERIDSIQKAIEALENNDLTDSSLYASLVAESANWEELQNKVDETSSTLIENIALLESAGISTEKYNLNTTKGFKNYRQALIDAVEANKLYKDSMGDVSDEVDLLLSVMFPQYSDVLDSIVDGTNELAIETENLKSTLDDLSSSMSSLQSIVDEYDKAGSLSAETVAKIASDTPELLKYIIKVGDEYKLNEQALIDLEDKQSKYNSTLDQYIELVKKSEFGSTDFAQNQLDFLNAIEDAYGETNSEANKYLDTIKKINQQLLDGKINVVDYFNKLQNQINKIDWSNIKSDQGLQALFTDLTMSAAQGLDYLTLQVNSGMIDIDQFSDSLLEANENLLDLYTKYHKLEFKNGEWAGAADEINKYANALQDSQDKLASFNDFSNLVTDNLDYISQHIDAAGQAMFTSADVGSNAYQKLATSMSHWLGQMKNTNREDWKQIVTDVATATNQSTNYLLTHQNALNNTLKTRAKGLTSAMNSGVKSYGEAMGDVLSSTGDVVSALADVISKFDFKLSIIPFIKYENISVMGFKVPIPSINLAVSGTGGESVQNAASKLKALAGNLSGLSISTSFNSFGGGGSGYTSPASYTGSGGSSGGSSGSGGSSSSSKTTENTRLQKYLDKIEHRRQIGYYELNEQKYIDDLIYAYKKLAKTKEEKWDLEEKIYQARKEYQEAELKREQERNEVARSTVIATIDEEIERLQKKNEEQEKANELEEAQQALADAKKNKNILMYHEGRGFIYEADKEAIDEAQDRLDELNNQAQIDKLEEYKSHWEDLSDTVAEQQSKIITAQVLGANWEKNILNGRLDILKDFSSKYKSYMLSIQRMEEHGNIKVSAIGRTLKFRSKGNDVKDLQKALIIMGYDISSGVSGIFGQATVRALKAFQKYAGIKVTGILDKATKSQFRLMGFAEGGIIDFTGPAMFHGTPSSAEPVFNARDAKKLYNYVHTTPNLVKDLMQKILPSINNIPLKPATANAMNLKIGDIYVSGINDVNQFADAVVKKFPNAIIQEIHKR